jgi:hypothetical protein
MVRRLLAGIAVVAMLLGGATVANAQWSLFYGHRNPAEAWWGGYPFVYAPGAIDSACGFRTVLAIRDGRVVLLGVPRC